MKRALITGATGQDGSYLAELLLEKGYEVHGTMRRVAADSQILRMSRIEHLAGNITMWPLSMENFASVCKVLQTVAFDECYHLAAQSFVKESFLDPFTTMDANINGTHHLLDALFAFQPKCRFYFAASSEMFGKAEETPQRETTPFHPRSPYGISKVAGFDLTRHYREAYGMFCCNGILFNHESPRRGDQFVTRKIAKAVAAIKAGRQKRLALGNLTACRDWGYAPEYVEAMWLMLQQDHPDDYVISTGEAHTVAEFLDEAFGHLNGMNWSDYVDKQPELIRPAEVDMLVGDASKARKVLGWQPKTLFKDLVRIMVEAEWKSIYDAAPYRFVEQNRECFNTGPVPVTAK